MVSLHGSAKVAVPRVWMPALPRALLGRRVRVVGIRDRSLMAMQNPPDLSRSGSLGISRRTVTSEDHHPEVARI